MKKMPRLSLLRIVAATCVIAAFAIAAVALWPRNAELPQPASQPELDALRGRIRMDLQYPEAFAVDRKMSAYWRDRMGIPDVEDLCPGVTGVVVRAQVWHAFSDSVDLVAIDGTRIRSGKPPHTPFAYLPANAERRATGTYRFDEPLVVNPEAEAVEIRSEVTALPARRWQRIQRHVRQSRLLRLPIEVPEEPYLDGSWLHMEICNDGLLYTYGRGHEVEPEIKALLRMLDEG